MQSIVCQKLSTGGPIPRRLLLLPALLLGCTHGEITDVVTGVGIPGATVSFSPAGFFSNACVSPLGCDETVVATALAYPFGLAIYDANPFLADGSTDASRLVASGWRRAEVSAPGYQTEVHYFQHGYTETCTLNIEGVPTDVSCERLDFALHPTGGPAFDLLPDLVPAPDAVHDNEITCVDLPNGVHQRILRVGAGAMNVGLGRVCLNTTTAGGVEQTVFASDNSATVSDTGGCSAFHALHQHIHMGHWLDLRVIQDDPSCLNPETRDDALCVLGHASKLSYEPRNTTPYDAILPGFEYDPNWGDCEWIMDPGWGDVYWSAFEAQFVVLPTDIVPGDYLIEVMIDPAGQITERRTDNNLQQIEVTIPAEDFSSCVNCTAGLTSPGCEQYADPHTYDGCAL